MVWRLSSHLVGMNVRILLKQGTFHLYYDTSISDFSWRGKEYSDIMKDPSILRLLISFLGAYLPA